MPHPLLDLRRALLGETKTQGTVTALTATTATVATRNGAVTVTANHNLVIGDRVDIKDGRAVKTRASGGQFQIHYV